MHRVPLTSNYYFYFYKCWNVFPLVFPSMGRQGRKRYPPDMITFVKFLVESPAPIRPVLQREQEKESRSEILLKIKLIACEFYCTRDFTKYLKTKVTDDITSNSSQLKLKMYGLMLMIQF